MRTIMSEFAALGPINEDEKKARADLEEEIRQGPLNWEHLCGMAAGINILTQMYPLAPSDMVYRITARLVMIVTAKLALEAIHEAEDLEGFPEELDWENILEKS